MKRFLLLIGSLIFVLSGCVVEFVDPQPNVRVIGNPVLATSYSLDLGQGRQAVICDDKTTLLDYAFEFEGTLTSWRSYLQGKDNPNDIQGDRTLTLASPEVTYNASEQTVRAGYQINAGGAPLLIAPSAIVIAEIRGYSIIHLEITGAGGYFKEVPVIGNCNELGL